MTRLLCRFSFDLIFNRKKRGLEPDDTIEEKRIWKIISLLSFVLLLNACIDTTPVHFKDVCQSGNNDKYISVEGFLRTGSSVLCSSREGNRECGIELTDKLDGDDKLNVYLQEGSSKGQMEPLPSTYSKDDLKVHSTDGKVLVRTDRVRVTGILKLGPDVANTTNSICYIDVESIDKP